MNALDLFAGPGGWDVAARDLGIDVLGVEFDDAACKTREAAGLRTHQGDVAALTPEDFGPVDGLIASPPCQAWSMAGKRGGERDKELVYRCARELTTGADTRARHRAECEDERSMLAVEPLRWALELEPRWLAWEQVPPVLDLWTLCARLLRNRGYRVWTGILSAERYGVPQTRKRAILLASLDGPVVPPEPTHQAYVPGQPAEERVDLFGTLKPWVSMAQALGWEGVDRPSPTVTGGGSDTGGPEVFGRGGREAIAKVRTGNFTAKDVEMRANAQKNAAVRGADEPAPTITGGHDTGDRTWKLRAGTNANDCERPVDAPAPTMRFGERLNDVSWVYDRRQTGGDGTPVGPRPVDEPAPTLGAQGLAKGRDIWRAEVDSGLGRGHENNHRGHPPACGCLWDYVDAGGFCACCEAHLDDPNGLYAEQGDGTHRYRDCPQAIPPSTAELQSDDWPESRPATTVVGDPRVFQPGGHHIEGQQSQNAIRVSEAEAATLQGFDPAYPFQGTRSQRFQQIGNAVPPPLARAVLEQLTGSHESRAAA